jgi:hypothetical protein
MCPYGLPGVFTGEFARFGVPGVYVFYGSPMGSFYAHRARGLRRLLPGMPGDLG